MQSIKIKGIGPARDVHRRLRALGHEGHTTHSDQDDNFWVHSSAGFSEIEKAMRECGAEEAAVDQPSRGQNIL